MKVFWLTSLFLLVGSITGMLPPPERPYKILMLLPISSKSHRNMFIPLAKGLAERGHKIVMFSNDDNPMKSKNIFEFVHDLPHFKVENRNMFNARSVPGAGFPLFTKMLTEMAREMYRLPKVKELYKKRKDFDLIIIDHLFNEMMYPLVHESTFITLATPGVEGRQSAVLGNPLNPSYVPSMLGGEDLSGVLGRLKNTFAHIATAVYWAHWAVLPKVQAEISAIFPDLPPLMEIERNQSLTLMNSHFSMDMSVPLLPSQIEVGCMHCRPGQPLSESLQSWIEGAGSAGVIYFSLGSVARSETIPSQYKIMLLEAFRRLEQRVIWKFESIFEDAPKNVLVNQWLPQQDILAHPNVKVFITHGGRLSLQESVYHATPLLALPIFGDQSKNAEHIVKKNFGLSLVWEEMTVDTIVKAINEIIGTSKYHETLDVVSKSFRDQMESPLDRAIYWTEYVIRHNGAPKLRSHAADLSWVQFLMLDVLAVITVILATVVLIVSSIFKKIGRLLVGRNSNKNKQE